MKPSKVLPKEQDRIFHRFESETVRSGEIMSAVDANEALDLQAAYD